MINMIMCILRACRRVYMSHYIVAMTNKIERTKCVSLHNNEQQNQRQI